MITTLRGISGGIDTLFRLAVPPLGALAPLPPPLPPPLETELVTTVKRYLFFKSLRSMAPQFLVNMAALGVGAANTVTVSQVEAIAQLLAGIPQDGLAKLAFDPGVSQSAGTEAYGYLVLAGNDPLFAARAPSPNRRVPAHPRDVEHRLA